MAGTGGDAPRPVLAWAHGTTGIVAGCAPSLMQKPFANLPSLRRILAEGWVYVATDYSGLGAGEHHTYLDGAQAARDLLDAVRAAQWLPELRLQKRLVAWGHSQGGNSALWTGALARDHAPELELLGVGAFAPASDLKRLLSAAQGTMFGKVVTSYLVHSLAAADPGFNAPAVLSPGTLWLTQDIASRCVGQWPTLVSALQTMLLPRQGAIAGDPSVGPLAAWLERMTPRGPFHAPVFIAQGENDDLVLASIQQAYAERLCNERQQVVYRAYPGRDHISLVAPDSRLAIDATDWTRDRFAGKLAEPSCAVRP
ncbi:MAG: lipase family protein [Beijerinckiaceae bacterium]